MWLTNDQPDFYISAKFQNLSIFIKVADPDSNCFRIQSGQLMRTRIRIRNPDPGPDPGGQK
jgi:hypothetical protein